jgi:hypothetical protein
MKQTLIGLLFFFCLSCVENFQEDIVSKQLIAIEIQLSIASDENSSVSVRIERIDSAISFLSAVQKRPSITSLEDTISIHSKFVADIVLAAHHPKSPPFVILESNDGVDTIQFSQAYGSMPIEIHNVVEGMNEYRGEIFEDGKTYLFEGWFYGRK